MTTAPPEGAAPSLPLPAARVTRWLFAVLGVVCFSLAAVGAVVPGLPTTVFLLAGSFFLARSCPALERKLLASRLLRPYARYLEPGAAMPRRARITAAALMWISIAVSAALLATRDAPAQWPVVLLVALGVAGTIAIARFRRPRPG